MCPYGREARNTRFMDWTSVIGQTEIKRQLQSLAEGHHVPHALLFCGPQGVGKLALAIGFAQLLLSEGNPEIAADPARLRNARAMLANFEHPDLYFSFPTIKTPSMGSDHKPVSDDFIKEWRSLIRKGPYITIDQWMTQIGAENQQSIITAGESDALLNKLSLKSSQGGYKVVVMWLPERMHVTCANKILKLLEEPPQQTVFLLVSEHPERLLETIRSRTQRIDVKRLEEKDIFQALVNERGLDENAARRVSRVAHGSWNEALKMLDAGNEERQFLDLFQILMRQCYMRNIKELRKWSEAAADLGRERQQRMLTYFLKQVRENFIFNFHNPELSYQTAEEEAFSRNFARFINETNVIEINELFQETANDIHQNANAKIVFFDMALKLIVYLLRK